MIETKNKHSLLYQYGTVSKEESCVFVSQMLSENPEKEEQVSDQRLLYLLEAIIHMQLFPEARAACTQLKLVANACSVECFALKLNWKS